ncbi:MAG TPA: hypothetical protein ENK91_15300, partial [Bacteroidetes bacterium]|nr:hypothetical protein [Bacteroidota bacterium]
MQLTSVENQRLQKITSKQIYSETAVVDFGELSEIQENGYIRIEIPGSACGSLKYKAKNVEYDTDDDFYWYGSLVSEDSCSCADGTLTLMAKEGRTFGYFSVDDEAYDIHGLSANKSTVSKIDNSKAVGGECGVTQQMERARQHSSDISVENRGGGHCNVRALVLFTNAENNAEANIQDRIDFFVARTNQALGNSGVGTCQLRISLAGEPVVVPVPFVENQTDLGIFDDVSFLATDPTIMALRNARDADIVVVLTDGDYGGGSTFGIVNAIGPDN